MLARKWYEVLRIVPVTRAVTARQKSRDFVPARTRTVIATIFVSDWRTSASLTVSPTQHRHTDLVVNARHRFTKASKCRAALNRNSSRSNYGMVRQSFNMAYERAALISNSSALSHTPTEAQGPVREGFKLGREAKPQTSH